MTRHPADWFSDYLYTAGYSIDTFPSAGNITFAAIALYNDDAQGRVMKVYGVSGSADGGENFSIYFQQGTIGSQVAQALSIRPDRPAPSGAVYAESVVVPLATPAPFSFPPEYGQFGTDGFDGCTYVSPFPLFIVPVGYSIIACNRSGAGIPAFWFWFLLANQ
jgi:hypothetical protein